MFSKSLFSALLGIFLSLNVNLDAVGDVSIECSSPQLNNCLNWIHNYYDNNFISTQCGDLAKMKKITAGVFISERSISSVSMADNLCCMVQELIKSGNATQQEAAIHFIDHLIFNRSSKFEESCCSDDDFFEDERDAFVSKQKYFFEMFTDLTNKSGTDANVCRACYDYFVQYFLGNREDDVDEDDSDVELLDSIIKTGLKSQDWFIYACSMMFKSFEMQMLTIHKTCCCSRQDFDFFKKDINNTNPFIRFCARMGLCHIAKLGYFVDELLLLAEDYLESDPNLVRNVIDELALNFYGVWPTKPTIQSLLDSTHEKEQLLGCFICARVLNQIELLKYSNLMSDEKKNAYNFLMNEINSSVVINGIEDEWEAFRVRARQLIEDNIIKLKKPLWVEYAYYFTSLNNELKNLNDAFFRPNISELYYDDSWDMKTIETVAYEYVNCDDGKTHDNALHLFKILVKNGIFNEQMKQGIEKTIKNFKHKYIFDAFIDLCETAVDNNVGVKHIVEIMDKVQLDESCDYDLTKDLLKLCRKLAHYPDFFNTGLRFIQEYNQLGGSISYGFDFEFFCSDLIHANFESSCNLNRIREAAEELIKNHKNFGDIRLGIAIYEELIENKTCLSECAAFIEHMKNNYDNSIHGFLAALDDKLVENDFAINEAIESARFLI